MESTSGQALSLTGGEIAGIILSVAAIVTAIVVAMFKPCFSCRKLWSWLNAALSSTNNRKGPAPVELGLMNDSVITNNQGGNQVGDASPIAPAQAPANTNMETETQEHTVRQTGTGHLDAEQEAAPATLVAGTGAIGTDSPAQLPVPAGSEADQLQRIVMERYRASQERILNVGGIDLVELPTIPDGPTTSDFESMDVNGASRSEEVEDNDVGDGDGVDDSTAHGSSSSLSIPESC